MIMFTKSLAHELKSTEIPIMILLQKGHNQRRVYEEQFKMDFPSVSLHGSSVSWLYYFCSKS